VTLKYVTQTTNTSGKTYYYFRRPRGKRIPLGIDPPGSAAFLERYSAALSDGPAAQPRTKQGSIAAVIEAFHASTKWTTYSASYKGTLDRHFHSINQAYGTAPIAGLRDRHIAKDIEQLAPHAARNRMKAWRTITAMAKSRGWAEGNAARDVTTVAPPKTDGHRPWPVEAIEMYRAHWAYGTPQRRAMELLYWSAARTIDAVRLSPAMVAADGILTFTQIKTKAKAHVPWTCPLPHWADGFEIDRAHLMAALRDGVFTYLETDAGKARTRKGLSNVISDGAKAANLIGLTAHGLRKSRLNRIAEASGTSQAIMAWGGHTSLQEAEEYIRGANRKLVISGTEQKQKSSNTPS